MTSAITTRAGTPRSRSIVAVLELHLYAFLEVDEPSSTGVARAARGRFGAGRSPSSGALGLDLKSP